MAKDWVQRKTKALGDLEQLQTHMQQELEKSARVSLTEDYEGDLPHLTAAIQILENASNDYKKKRATLIQSLHRGSAPADINYDDLDEALVRADTIAEDVLARQRDYRADAEEVDGEVFLDASSFEEHADATDVPEEVEDVDAHPDAHEEDDDAGAHPEGADARDAVEVADVHAEAPEVPAVNADAPLDVNTSFPTILARLESFEFRAGTQVAADFQQLVLELRNLPEHNRHTATRAMRNLCVYFEELSQPLEGDANEQAAALANRHTQAKPELDAAIKSLLGHPNALLQNIGITFMAISAALLLAVTVPALLALLPAAAVSMPAAAMVIPVASTGVVAGALGIAGFFGGRPAAPYTTAEKLAKGIIADENLGTLVTVRRA